MKRDLIVMDKIIHSDELFHFMSDNSKALFGIGCDIIEIERIRVAYSRIGSYFISKICTSDEQTYFIDMQDPIPSFAARFAAKEALSKAIGTGIGHNLGWHDIEIFKQKDGKPYVVWASHIIQRYSLEKTHLSLSHNTTHAIAFCAVTTQQL